MFLGNNHFVDGRCRFRAFFRQDFFENRIAEHLSTAINK